MIQASLIERHEPIAALYVEPGGPYFELSDVDCWGKSRDAGAELAHPESRFARQSREGALPGSSLNGSLSLARSVS